MPFDVINKMDPFALLTMISLNPLFPNIFEIDKCFGLIVKKLSREPF